MTTEANESSDGLEPAVRRLTDELASVRREMRHRTIALVALLLAVVLVGYAVSTDADRRIDRNSRELATVAYRQCQTIDATNKRQIELINSAIVAERRKPAPDLKRIADLEKFRPNRVDCGPPPR